MKLEQVLAADTNANHEAYTKEFGEYCKRQDKLAFERLKFVMLVRTARPATYGQTNTALYYLFGRQIFNCEAEIEYTYLRGPSDPLGLKGNHYRRDTVDQAYELVFSQLEPAWVQFLKHNCKGQRIFHEWWVKKLPTLRRPAATPAASLPASTPRSVSAQQTAQTLAAVQQPISRQVLAGLTKSITAPTPWLPAKGKKFVGRITPFPPLPEVAQVVRPQVHIGRVYGIASDLSGASGYPRGLYRGEFEAILHFMKEIESRQQTILNELAIQKRMLLQMGASRSV
jgi:hypothetical protein